MSASTLAWVCDVCARSVVEGFMASFGEDALAGVRSMIATSEYDVRHLRYSQDQRNKVYLQRLPHAAP
jgi:hypothetical protein